MRQKASRFPESGRGASTGTGGHVPPLCQGHSWRTGHPVGRPAGSPPHLCSAGQVLHRPPHSTCHGHSSVFIWPWSLNTPSRPGCKPHEGTSVLLTVLDRHPVHTDVQEAVPEGRMSGTEQGEKGEALTCLRSLPARWLPPTTFGPQSSTGEPLSWVSASLSWQNPGWRSWLSD